MWYQTDWENASGADSAFRQGHRPGRKLPWRSPQPKQEAPAAPANTLAQAKTEKPQDTTAKKQPSAVEPAAGRRTLRSLLIPWGIVAAAAVLVLIIAVIVIVSRRGDKYRVIKVEGYSGSVDITRGNDSIDIFNGLQFVAGDQVSTGSSSVLTPPEPRTAAR